MRISVDRRDRGYRWDASKFRVRVNGELVPNVVTADEELGLIVRYQLDGEGRPRVAPDGKHYMLETVSAKVEIEAHGEGGVSLREPKVKVERDRDGVLEVLVYSRIKPGAIRRVVLDEKTLNTRRWTLDAAVAICGGAAAEHLCKVNGDLFDPSDCAVAATAAYQELLAKEAQAKRLH